MDNSDLLSYEKLEAHKVLMWVLLIPAIFVFLFGISGLILSSIKT